MLKSQVLQGDRSWRGLAQELQFWSKEVLAGTKANVGELWLEGTGAVEYAKIIRCPDCGEKSPLAAGAAGSSSTPSIRRASYYRGYAACPCCGAQVPLRAVETEGWIPVALVGEDLRTELPLSAHVTDVLAGAEYPTSLASRLHETWAVARSGPISHRDGTTARQASILDAFRRSIRRAREEMADAGYPLIASLHCQHISGWLQATLSITCAQAQYCGKGVSSQRFPGGHGSQGMSL